MFVLNDRLIQTFKTQLFITFYDSGRKGDVLKLLGANLFVFCVGENSEFPLTIRRRADQYISASWG